MQVLTSHQCESVNGGSALLTVGGVGTFFGSSLSSSGIFSSGIDLWHQM